MWPHYLGAMKVDVGTKIVVQNRVGSGDINARSGYIAVLVFPVIIIIGGIIGISLADPISSGRFLIDPILAIIMFAMGLTLRISDVTLALKKPLAIVLVVAGQFICMPLVAVFVSWILQLPPELAAGVILVGAVSGGVTSNVVTYLARGDVALSVAMTSVSTLLTPIVTPVIALLLAGQYMAVDGGGMVRTVVFVVLLPVIVGIALRHFAAAPVLRILPSLPWVSVIGASVLVAILVAGAADLIVKVGIIVFVAALMHNVIGMVVGYALAALAKQPVKVRRTMAIEIGIQNAGLAGGLAAQYMSPVSALPGAVFSILMNVTGAIYAAWCRYRDRRETLQGASADV